VARITFEFRLSWRIMKKALAVTAIELNALRMLMTCEASRAKRFFRSPGDVLPSL
jgi:hypothetical protein